MPRRIEGAPPTLESEPDAPRVPRLEAPAARALRVALVAGGAPKPDGRALRPSDVPDDATLRELSAVERERLLIGLGLSLADQDAPAVRDALRRVLEATNAVTLKQVLELSASRRSLGFVVEKLGLETLLELGRQRGVAVNDILATTDSVKERGLTTREAQRLRENFAGTLDPETIRFRFTTGVQTIGAGALVIGNTINVDPSDPRWKLAPGTTQARDPGDEGWDSFNSVLLAHEPSHVWSYQHQGTRYAINSVNDQVKAMVDTGSRSAAYFYTPNETSFFNYGEEQRAMIVQDFVTATHAKRHGEAKSYTMYGGLRPVDEVLAKLKPFIDQMRGVGPGQPQPPGGPHPVLCECVPIGSFTQDGAAGALGQQADALVGATGRAATTAIVEGVKEASAVKVALGTAGVAAAAVASTISREQNANGASGGGSAVLDQAGIPRGLEVSKDGVSASVKAAWDAPAPPKGQGFGLGFKDARVEYSAGAKGEVAGAEVRATGNATVGIDGQVRSAGAGVRVEKDDVSVSARAQVKPQRGDAPLRANAEVQVVTQPVAVTAQGSVVAKDGKVQAATVQARVDTRPVAVTGDASFAAPPDAPLALKEANVGVALTPSPDVAVGVNARLVPRGLDALQVQVAGTNDAGSIAIAGYGKDLTTQPKVGVEVSATEKKSGVTVTANAETKPATGEAQVGVGVKVPLP